MLVENSDSLSMIGLPSIVTVWLPLEVSLDFETFVYGTGTGPPGDGVLHGSGNAVATPSLDACTTVRMFTVTVAGIGTSSPESSECGISVHVGSARLEARARAHGPVPDLGQLASLGSVGSPRVERQGACVAPAQLEIAEIAARVAGAEQVVRERRGRERRAAPPAQLGRHAAALFVPP